MITPLPIIPSIPFLLVMLLINIHVPPTSGVGVTNKIDPELQRKIDSAPAGSTWDIIVGFKKGEDLLQQISSSDSAAAPTVEESSIKVDQVLAKLEKYAEQSQGIVVQGIRAYERGRSTGGKKFKLSTLWYSNELLISAATKDLIYELGGKGNLENENITKIVEDEVYPLDDGMVNGERVDLTDDGGLKARQGGPRKKPFKETWGLEKINAPAWWNKDYNGTGVIIGHIDTGVDIRHPSLKWNWLGQHGGWKDPEGPIDNTFPFEQDKTYSHGTHTLGIIVGRGKGSTSSQEESDLDPFGVGVAPGARWISCLGCRITKADGTAGCQRGTVGKCGQFLVCPYKDGGGRCHYKPRVIFSANACSQTESRRCKAAINESFDPVINLWKRAGIIPVFPAGNDGDKGSGRNTVSDPGDHEDVLTVGNVDKNDVLATDSSMGPPEWRYNLSYINQTGLYKPNFVAPGTNIFSTVYTGQSGRFAYDYKTGTSMAAPHLVGAIALLLSRSENMTLEDIVDILKRSAVKHMSPPCEGKEDGLLPNHKFGWGRLRLPYPDDTMLPPVRIPTRKMPPTPDYSDLAENSTPPSVRPGMVGVVIMMAAIGFLMIEM